MKIRGLCQFADVNGLPYAGGKLNVYVIGTTTHANLYKDEACTIPHTWPARLDTRGCIKAFANQNISIELFDKNDNRVDSWDEKLGLTQDAPSDGKQYCRKNGSWEEIVIPNPEWNDIQNKPSTFTPASHTHNVSDITNMPTIIPEAPIDDKQYARKNAGWVEVQGGGDEPEIFKIIPGIEDLGIDPTPFTDILEASRAGKYLVVECGIEGTYILNGTVTNFNYDEDDQTGGLQCVVSMEVPEYYMTPIKYICDLAYDASAATTDTWTVSEPVNIMAPDDISEDGMVPTLQTLYGDRKVISWKFPAVVEVEHLSTTPYTDVASIMARGSSPVYWELGTLYLYLGIGTVDSATGYVFGSIRQEDDGTLYMQKRVAKSDETWYAPSTHFPIGGGGADNTFVVTPGAIAALTATPTPFTDIKTAFQASKVIQAHAIVNGEGVYGYLQAFQFNTTTNKGTAVFAFYNSNPNYLNGTDFIITCSYDASASPTDTWEQSVQMPIPAPAASDANKVLKANSSGNAVGWDKVKSSELTNDAGFSKVVVGNAPPAAGTPDDTITLILGGAGGAGEYGAWELIGEGSAAVGTVISLSKSVRDFDIVVFTIDTNQTGENNNMVSGLAFTSQWTFDGRDAMRAGWASTNCIGIFDNDTSLRISTNTQSSFVKHVKLYGINLKGSKKDVIEEFSMISRGIVTDLQVSSNHKIEIECELKSSEMWDGNVIIGCTRASGASPTGFDCIVWQGKVYQSFGDSYSGDVAMIACPASGFHTIVINDDNGNWTLDGTICSSTVPTYSQGYYVLGGRGINGELFPLNAPYKKIKITDKSTSQVVLDVECFDKDGLRYIVDKYHHFNAILR